MAATAAPLNALASIDPATGETLGYVEATAVSTLTDVIRRARIAQIRWGRLPITTRCAHLKRLRDAIMSSRTELAEAVVRESGKPRVEALFADIFVAVDSAAYFGENTARIVRPKRLCHHSTAAQAKSGYLSYEPLGVIGMITSWNYPLAIPMS
jgi:succinate-semialdehyde dehydrogenase / glutarate-semialdehyde dehydrogenase